MPFPGCRCRKTSYCAGTVVSLGNGVGLARLETEDPRGARGIASYPPVSAISVVGIAAAFLGGSEEGEEVPGAKTAKRDSLFWALTSNC